MAFDTTNLSVVGYANGFTIWHYRTSDMMPEVMARGYFDVAHRLVCAGDLMTINASGDNALAFVTEAYGHIVRVQAIAQTEPTIKQDAAA